MYNTYICIGLPKMRMPESHIWDRIQSERVQAGTNGSTGEDPVDHKPTKSAVCACSNEH